jgi:hypothetical protein
LFWPLHWAVHYHPVTMVYKHTKKKKNTCNCNNARNVQDILQIFYLNELKQILHQNM